MITPKVLVGHDASGLELRMLAHYLNRPEYTEAVQNKPHDHHQMLLELDTRDQAKEFIYKFNYGGGALLIGLSVYKIDEIIHKYPVTDAAKAYAFLQKRANKEGMINIGKDTYTKLTKDMAYFQLAGQDLKDKFYKNCDGLYDLNEAVKEVAKERGYLIGLDGRRIHLRRDINGKVQDHKALNTLLQTAGAVVMKHSMVILDRLIREHGLHSKKILDMHDEAQFECLPEEADKHGELAVKSIIMAGEQLGLRCPLDAEYKVGRSWDMTH